MDYATVQNNSTVNAANWVQLHDNNITNVKLFYEIHSD